MKGWDYRPNTDTRQIFIYHGLYRPSLVLTFGVPGYTERSSPYLNPAELAIVRLLRSQIFLTWFLCGAEKFLKFTFYIYSSHLEVSCYWRKNHYVYSIYGIGYQIVPIQHHYIGLNQAPPVINKTTLRLSARPIDHTTVRSLDPKSKIFTDRKNWKPGEIS